MKNFEELNYYELLEISFDASPFEIKKAYKNALSIYDENSLLTYSLFVDAERKKILKKIEDAYDTLIDKSKRKSYDAMLRVRSFVVDNHDYKNHAHLPDDNKRVLPGHDKDSYPTYNVRRPIKISSPDVGDNSGSHESSHPANARSFLTHKEKSAESQNPRIFRKFLRKLSRFCLLITVILVFVLIASSAVYTSWDFPKKIYFASFKGVAHHEVAKSEVLVQVPLVENSKED